MSSQATQITKEVLGKMGFENADIQERMVSGRTKIDIKIADARSLIGERGSTLAMFQHIVRRISSKRHSYTISAHPAASAMGGTGSESDFLSSGLSESASVGAEHHIDIDVNGYKLTRENILKDFARDIAQRVRSQRKSVELEPMPSFDRRVIHLALSSFPDLVTESMGEGSGRYIVVRLYP